MKKNILLVFVVLLIIGLASGGYMFTRKNKKPAKTTETFVTSAQEPTVEPTTEPQKSDFPILVLNGSGKVGAAGTMQKILEDAGYTVADTDNADSYDYVKTEIRLKKNVAPSFADELKQAIESKKYTVVVGDELADDAKADVEVIVGSNGEAPIPKPTAAATTPAPTKSTETQVTTKPTITVTPTVSPTP